MAAKIAVMRMLLGSDEPAAEEARGRVHAPHAPRTSAERLGHIRVETTAVAARVRRFAVAAAVLVAVAAGVSASWAWIARVRPLLEDNFNDRAIDPRNWRTLRRVVSEENGYLVLRNRGYVVTNKEFSWPLTVDLDWRPLDVDGDAYYLDILTVALHTTDAHRTQHAYEAQEGLLVKFNPKGGNVSVGAAIDINTDRQSLANSSLMSVPFPSGDWQHLRIVDDGSTVLIYVGPSAAETPDEPILQVPYNPEDFPGTRIAIYNREFVGGANHESHIDNVVVRTGAW